MVRMMKKTVKSYDTFALLSLTLILMFSMVTLAPANAVSHTDGGKEGADEKKEKSHTATANGAQVNLCDASDGACIQANEDQSASGGDNKVVGFNDQSGTSAPNNDKAAAEQAGNSTDFVMKIDGIDYSTVKVKVWVTADGGREVSKTFNPIPLLDPEDDDRGLIFVPMKAEKGLLDIGDAYTACIKVIEDTDKYGNKQSCQQSVLTLVSPDEVGGNPTNTAASSPASSTGADSASASADGDEGGSGSGTAALSGDGGVGIPVMRITL